MAEMAEVLFLSVEVMTRKAKTFSQEINWDKTKTLVTSDYPSCSFQRLQQAKTWRLLKRLLISTAIQCLVLPTPNSYRQLLCRLLG